MLHKNQEKLNDCAVDLHWKQAEILLQSCCNGMYFFHFKKKKEGLNHEQKCLDRRFLDRKG